MNMDVGRIDPSNVAALIPAYLEEEHIGDVVRRSRAQVERVIVVDDGSSDATADRAREAGAAVIRHESNRGKGAAIKTGFLRLAAEPVQYVVILDGDGQHLPEEIPRFIEAATRTGARMLVGNRMAGSDAMPVARRLTNRFMSWQISRICGQPVPDTQCGFRMIHRELLPKLQCDSDAYEYETEMLFIAVRGGHRIEPVPVSTIYGTEKSAIRPLRDAVRFLRLLKRYRQADAA